MLEVLDSWIGLAYSLCIGNAEVSLFIATFTEIFVLIVSKCQSPVQIFKLLIEEFVSVDIESQCQLSCVANYFSSLAFFKCR